MSVGKEKTTAERLLEGARLIGQLWRGGARCITRGWTVKRVEGVECSDAQLDPEELCQCKEKQTKFCKAKIQWLLLAMVEPREIETGEYGLLLTMKAAEWDATGLTLLIENEKIGQIKVGPKGGIRMVDLKELMGNPESGLTTLKLLRSLPNAKMEFETVKSEEAGS